MGLDAVELIISIEETFGVVIPDADSSEMVTPDLLIKYVQDAVGASADSRPCLSRRAFYEIRTDLMSATGLPRSEILPSTLMSTLFPVARRKADWELFRERSSLRRLPKLRFGRRWLFSPSSVRDLVSAAVAQHVEYLKASRNWSLGEVREIVRCLISEQVGIKRFADTDEFVRDLGFD